MNRIKIYYYGPEYFVNHEKKAVTCKLSYDIISPDNLWPIILEESVKNNSSIFKCAKATTFCHGEDVFDVSTGMKVALAKAEINAERQVTKLMRKVQNRLEELSTIVCNRLEESALNCEHNYEYLEKNF